MPSRNTSLERFSTGDAVRARSGVAAPDYLDILVGGWLDMLLRSDRELAHYRWNDGEYVSVSPDTESNRATAGLNGCQITNQNSSIFCGAASKRLLL